MQEESIITQMNQLGISDREARLYCALLRKSEATAAELQRLSGVPRTKIYEALESLVDRGFSLVRHSGRSKFYKAVSPEEVMALLSNRWELDHEKKINTSQSVFSDLLELYKSQKAEDQSLDVIEVIRSREQIHQRYVSLVASAREEILAFIRSPLASKPRTSKENQQNQAEADAGDQGVVKRCIYRYEPDHQEWMRRNISLAIENGDSFRINYDVPMKMFVFDRKITLFAIPSLPGLSGTDFTMAVVQDAGLAEANRILFNTIWDGSSTHEEWEQGEHPLGLDRR